MPAVKGNTRKISFVKDRLKKMMKDRRYTRSSLCDALGGFSVDTFSGYMKSGTIMPDVLTDICKVLDCDEDYITGFEDEDCGYHPEFKNTDMFKDIPLSTYIPKPEFYATLFEIYDFPEDVIRSIKTTPNDFNSRGGMLLGLLDQYMLHLKNEEMIRLSLMNKKK